MAEKQTDMLPTGMARHGLSTREFTRRALIAGAVAVSAVLVVAFAWYAGQVLMLTFAAILAGIFLRGLSERVERRLGLSDRWSLTLVVLTLVVLAALTGWLFAASIAEQVGQLQEQIPRALDQARQRVEQTSWGRQLLSQLQRGGAGGQGGGGILSSVGSLFTTTVGGLVNFAVVVIAGLYFAYDGRTYRHGIIGLLPHARRERAGEVLGAIGRTLWEWLVARFAVMALNGIITGGALWLLGVPLAFVLGLLTALLNFIPNIGPILAMIPAVLMASTTGPNKVLYVVLLYVAVQNLEGFVLTPIVEGGSVALPGAVIILTQLLFGVLMGTLGLLLSTPLVAAIFVLVKMLYVEDMLGDEVELPGDDSG